MSQEPDFTPMLSRLAREKADQEQQEQQAKAIAEQERQRSATIATEQLENLVTPILEKAQADMQALGFLSEIGNGRDAYRNLRRTLRITNTRKPFQPVLVFTANTCGQVPFLGHHSEFYTRAEEYFPQRINDPSSQTVVSIVSEFIQQAIRTL